MITTFILQSFKFISVYKFLYINLYFTIQKSIENFTMYIFITQDKFIKYTQLINLSQIWKKFIYFGVTKSDRLTFATGKVL